MAAIFSAQALEMSSTGRITTWLRTPTRPFCRRYAMTFRLIAIGVLLVLVVLLVVEIERRASVAVKRKRCALRPPLGFDVVNVHVLAGLDRLDDFADVDAVLDDAVAGAQI